MSSRLKRPKSGSSNRKPPTGVPALRRVRHLISKNRLTAARIQRMQLREMLVLATILRAAHDITEDDKERAAIKSLVAFVAQTAEEQYGKQQ